MDLKVPKRRVVVELSSPGRAPRRVALFVGERHAGGGARRQEVLDLLEHAQRFLPVYEVADDAYAFVNKDCLQWVSLPHDRHDDTLDEPDGDEPLYDLRCAVRVDLADGAALDGKVLYTAPVGQTRLSDFLNQAGRFFRLYTDAGIVLVNQSFVARVVETARGGA